MKISYKNQDVEVENEMTVTGSELSDIPTQYLFVSDMNKNVPHFAFDIRELKENINNSNRLHNFYANTDFSQDDLNTLHEMDPILATAIDKLVSEQQVNFSPSILQAMKMLSANVSNRPEDKFKKIVLGRYSTAEIKEITETQEETPRQPIRPEEDQPTLFRAPPRPQFQHLDLDELNEQPARPPQPTPGPRLDRFEFIEQPPRRPQPTFLFQRIDMIDHRPFLPNDMEDIEEFQILHSPDSPPLVLRLLALTLILEDELDFLPFINPEHRDVSPENRLVRDVAFAEFREFYKSLNDEEKLSIDNFKLVKNILSRNGLGNSLGSILTLPAESCVMGIKSVCDYILNETQYVDNEKQRYKNYLANITEPKNLIELKGKLTPLLQEIASIQIENKSSFGRLSSLSRLSNFLHKPISIKEIKQQIKIAETCEEVLGILKKAAKNNYYPQPQKEKLQKLLKEWIPLAAKLAGEEDLNRVNRLQNAGLRGGI